jgi:hypothetical protein
MRSKGISPLIRNLGIDRGEWSTSGPGCFILGKQLTAPRLSGPQSQGGCFEEDKKSIVPIGNQIPDRPAYSLVTIQTTIFRLLWLQKYLRFYMNWNLNTKNVYFKIILQKYITEQHATGPFNPQYGASSGCMWSRFLHILSGSANIRKKYFLTADKGCVRLTTSYPKSQEVNALGFGIKKSYLLVRKSEENIVGKRSCNI